LEIPVRAYLLAIVLLVLLLGGTALYIQQRFAAMASGNFAPPPVTVAAGVAELRSWRETIDAVGTVRAAPGHPDECGDQRRHHAAARRIGTVRVAPASC
jgi:multidrug efflux pump subunit AcrA (membrane-fusion protein)